MWKTVYLIQCSKLYISFKKLTTSTKYPCQNLFRICVNFSLRYSSLLIRLLWISCHNEGRQVPVRTHVSWTWTAATIWGSFGCWFLFSTFQISCCLVALALFRASAPGTPHELSSCFASSCSSAISSAYKWARIDNVSLFLTYMWAFCFTSFQPTHVLS